MVYSYPTDYQIRLIRKYTNMGLDKWSIEEKINNPNNHKNQVIIDYIEIEMEIAKNLEKWHNCGKNAVK